ncbi:MAG TPA: zinc ribbon domain-containing protein [Solirubrobacteraceae bacterium]
MPAPIGYFGISNNGVNLAINLVILFLAIVWLAMIYWTRTDAKRRISDPVLVAAATAASLFPFVGTIVYMIVRPPEFLEDVRERDLEMAAAEARLSQLSYFACQHCGQEVEKDYLICPNCRSRLRDPCSHCHRPLEMTWTVCPYCETPVSTRSSRRRREALAGDLPPAP